MLIIVLIILLAYLFIMVWLFLGIKKLQFSRVKSLTATSSFTICIPFRNEELYVENLLYSLKNIDYPTHLYEIILVNDFSSDASVSIYKSFLEAHPYVNAQITHAQNPHSTSPKKEALLQAIKLSTKEYIVTTDADCEVPPKWLQGFNNKIKENQADFIAGPVSYFSTKNFLNYFQRLDFLSLQAATLGGFGQRHPFLCNGANLCYKKETFFNVNAFAGNHHIASGDDIFLLEKMIENKKNIQYVASAEAMVFTHATKSWKGLFLQRLRWASKTTASKSIYSKSIGTVIFLANVGLVIMGILCIFKSAYLLFFFEYLFIKMIIEFVVLIKVADLFKLSILKKDYLYVSFIYPIFISATAILSLFKSYSWKERTFKK